MTADDTVIVVDLETTGLDPRDCGILEIGAVHLASPARSAECSFSRDVRYCCGDRWEREAEEVHGIPREVALSHSRYDPMVALDEFLDWIEETGDGRRMILAGMNPAFDRGFLQSVAGRVRDYGEIAMRWRALVSHRTIDMHTLAVAAARRRGLPISRLHTDAIYEMLGMAPEPRPHRAITGARMEAEAIQRLLTEPENFVEKEENERLFRDLEDGEMRNRPCDEELFGQDVVRDGMVRILDALGGPDSLFRLGFTEAERSELLRSLPCLR